MDRKMWSLLALGLLTMVVLGSASTARAQYYQPTYPSYQLNRLFYYPYYYFPHNYWPAMGPKYPEGPNQPYMRPPAYMAYPAFRQAGWRYEAWEPQRFYQGNHFWLDQF